MGKYDGLRRYLRRQSEPETELHFGEIERMMGALLPKAARERGWWRDLTDPRVQQTAWRAVGYEADLIGMDRVIFRRRASSTQARPAKAAATNRPRRQLAGHASPAA